MKKQVIIGLGITVLLLLSGVAIRHAIPDRKEVQNSRITVRTEIRDTQSKETETVMQATETQAEEPVEPEEVSVSGLRAQREDAGHIKIQWEDDPNAVITGYSVERRDNRTDKDQAAWTTVGEVDVAKQAGKQQYAYMDTLGSEDLQQYVYRVVPQLRDTEAYVAAKGSVVLCSNWKICIDPGHYAGKNEVPGTDSYGYAEGDFTLQVALELQERLEKDYGIAVSMTRDTGSISIGGYTDAALDSGHISLRGSYAAEQGCNLFVSIHTNANEDNANGAGTFQQPIAIDKPIVIANDRMLSSDVLREVCNEVGQNLAEASYELGISSHKDFTALSGSKAREWTTSYNDSIREQGTVVCRHGNHGQYYGVLRGAEEAGIPGVIIEHGYHTVVEMRNAAKNGNLKSKWADADADGIASAMGFHKLSK